jgi:hypothetical protein
MARVFLIIALVLTLDVALFFLGWGGVVTTDMLEAGRAARAYGKNPTFENQRRLNTTRQQAEIAQSKVTAVFSLGILLVTASGFFIAGREFERRAIPRTSL